MANELGVINNPPYFDDFDSKKNYSKILFRPGRAIQARELTQIQTTLQNQIAALGNKLLQSPVVSGGELQVATVKYLRFLDVSVAGTVTDPAFLKNKLLQIISGTNTFSAKILHIQDPVDYELSRYVLMFEQKSGSSLVDVTSINTAPTGDGISSFSATIIDEESLEQSTATFRLQGLGLLTATTGVPIYGDGLLARVNSGIFFKNGYFIVSDVPLFLAISTKASRYQAGFFYRNFTTTSQIAKIGIKLSTEYVTFESDPSLYDPSAGFYNFAAPGADRLKLSPSLVFIDSDNTDTDIIEIAQINNGDVKDPTSSTFVRGDCRDQVLRPFVMDIIGSTLNISDGRAIVNCTDIEIIENQRIAIPVTDSKKHIFNQAFNKQCLSDAILVQGSVSTPLFGGASGSNFGEINTNYYGSGKIKKLFSDEAVRLEIVNCDGIKIGCLTALDFSKEDENSYRLYYNELQSYVSSIPASSLFAESCTLSLDGETVFSIYSPNVLTCADTVPNSKQRLVYKINRGTNTIDVTDNDYTITRDFVGDISGTEIQFNMDISGGVFNDNSTGVGNPDLFTVVINGKQVPINSNTTLPYIEVDGSRTKATVKLGGDGLVFPSLGRAYLVAKVRFPEKTNTADITPEPHRKKILKEAKGVYLQNLSTNPTVSLGFSDVYKIVSVSVGTSSLTLDNFVFDDGQRNDRYDHATITLDPTTTSIPTSDTEITVTFRYFEHQPISSGFYGPITVNSYGFDQNGAEISGFHGLDLNGNQLTLSYDEIPNFVDRISGEVISLSDAIDYRMFRTEEGYVEDGLNKSSILRGRWFPSPDETAAVEAAYIFNMPRIDLLTMRQDGVIKILAGDPSENPVPPEYPKDGCVLAEIKVPGIITSSEDYIIQKTPIKSISISEMNDIQNRLAEVEKSLSLKTLENKARAYSASLNNEFLTGMVVDDFGGHYVGDIANDEYNCSMDFSNGTLQPPFSTTFYDFVPQGSYPTSEEIIARDYYIMSLENTNGVALVSNEQATSEVLVNSFGSVDWHGYLVLDRPGNMWLDQTTKPVVRNNPRGQNDSWEAGGSAVQTNGRNKGFGTQWGFWRSLWFGDKILADSSTEKDRASAKGLSDAVASAAPSRFPRSVIKDSLFAPQRRTVGSGAFSHTDDKTSRYVDMSLNFFSPKNYIIVRGYDLKPNSEFDVYFDNVTTPVASSRILSVSTSSVSTVLSSITTDSNGFVEFILAIPAGTYLTGNKTVKLIEKNVISNPSYATAIYENIGSDWKNRANGDDNSVELEKAPIGRSDLFIKNENTQYLDITSNNSLVQTFSVDSGDYPEGLILQKIRLYIADKDDSLPLTIEIRKLENGVVDKFNIIKNSRITVNSSLLNVESDNDIVFRSPVYLAAGQYALVVKTNSKNYKVQISQNGFGRIDENTGGSTNLYATTKEGMLAYYSSGIVSSGGDSSTTLRFSLFRRSFQTNTDNTKRASVRGLTSTTTMKDLVASSSSHDYLYFSNNNSQLTTGSVDLQFGGENIAANTDIKFSGTIAPNQNPLLTVTVSTTREEISPIVDIRKLGMLSIKNNLSSITKAINGQNILEYEKKSFAGSDGSSMKYITRRTDLDLPANLIRASFEVKLPNSVSIRAYGKVLYEGDTDFDNEPYSEMVLVFGNTDSSKQEFKELVYEYDATSNPKNFISFSVKIVLFAPTENSSLEEIPMIRNLTIVSTVR